jgi:hypothetical protein
VFVNIRTQIRNFPEVDACRDPILISRGEDDADVYIKIAEAFL